MADAIEMTALQAADLAGARALSSALGWPYRQADWAFAHGLGRGFALKHDGALIGTAMGWNHGPHFATVGMIIVDGAYRGQGLGGRLVDALLVQAGDRAVILNATPDGLDIYRRRGFAGFGTTCQHQGQLAGLPPRDPALRIEHAAQADWPQLIALDQRAAGMPRDRLLGALAGCGTASVLRGGDGQPLGYALCRAFGRGYVIGPVVAPDVAAARALISEAMAGLDGSFVRIDTSAQSGLCDWLEECGLVQVDRVEAMVRGNLPPASPDARIFALCSQSLG